MGKAACHKVTDRL